jgi:E3 ubiquitin-protein ligase SIAH1
VAESLELPCKYYSLGCPEIFPYYSKLKHETVCNFRPYSCPYAGSECSVVGDIPFLVAHLRDDHKVDMHTGCTFNHRYVKSNPREVENATWMLTVSVTHFLSYFFLTFRTWIGEILFRFLINLPLRNKGTGFMVKYFQMSRTFILFHFLVRVYMD